MFIYVAFQTFLSGIISGSHFNRNPFSFSLNDEIYFSVAFRLSVISFILLYGKLYIYIILVIPSLKLFRHTPLQWGINDKAVSLPYVM